MSLSFLRTYAKLIERQESLSVHEEYQEVFSCRPNNTVTIFQGSKELWYFVHPIPLTLTRTMVSILILKM